MLRATLGCLLGTLLGAAVASGLLVGCHYVLREITAPRVFAVEHNAVYLGVILGAGFGAVAGTLIGLAGCLITAARPGPAPPTSP